MEIPKLKKQNKKKQKQNGPSLRKYTHWPSVTPLAFNSVYLIQ